MFDQDKEYPTSNGGSGPTGKYYGNVQYGRGLNAVLTPEQFYSDLSRGKFETVSNYPQKGQDFFYGIQGAIEGKNVYSPQANYGEFAENEITGPVAGTLEKVGTPFDVYTLRQNQGLFKNVPILEDLVPTLTKGAFNITALAPTDLLTIFTRLQTDPKFAQEFEASDFKSFKNMIDTGQAIIRNRGTVIGQFDDGSVLLTQERGGKWTLPGGGIKTGVDPVTGALRELNQEVSGIKATDPTSAGNYKGKLNFFYRSGAPFRDDNALVKVSLSGTPEVNSAEIVNTMKWQPGTKLPASTDIDAINILKQAFPKQSANILPDQFIGAGDKVFFDLDKTLVDSKGNLRPGVLATLNLLNENGIQYGLFTNSEEARAIELINKSGLGGYFKVDPPGTPDINRAFITRGENGYTNEADTADKAIPKNIQRYGGKALIDDRLNQIKYQNDNGNIGIKTTPYKGGSSYDMVNVRDTLQRYINAAEPEEIDLNPSAIAAEEAKPTEEFVSPAQLGSSTYSPEQIPIAVSPSTYVGSSGSKGENLEYSSASETPSYTKPTTYASEIAPSTSSSTTPSEAAPSETTPYPSESPYNYPYNYPSTEPYRYPSPSETNYPYPYEYNYPAPIPKKIFPTIPIAEALGNAKLIQQQAEVQAAGKAYGVYHPEFNIIGEQGPLTTGAELGVGSRPQYVTPENVATLNSQGIAVSVDNMQVPNTAPQQVSTPQGVVSVDPQTLEQVQTPTVAQVAKPGNVQTVAEATTPSITYDPLSDAQLSAMAAQYNTTVPALINSLPASLRLSINSMNPQAAQALLDSFLASKFSIATGQPVPASIDTSGQSQTLSMQAASPVTPALQVPTSPILAYSPFPAIQAAYNTYNQLLTQGEITMSQYWQGVQELLTMVQNGNPLQTQTAEQLQEVAPITRKRAEVYG